MRIIPARAGFTRGVADRPETEADHPRSRGVYHWGIKCQGPSGGIIPARAGFTGPRTWTRARPWDHPRSRGVYTALTMTIGTVTGSSPLARGLRDHCTENLRAFRIIPARAGFTPIARIVGTVSTDHPRSRGVYSYRPHCRYGQHGSSPLARGLLVVRVNLRSRVRIIPARAGFTY